MVKGLHLQLCCYPLLWVNVKWFNIKAAAAHHPFIQNEVDELLGRGAIASSTGAAGFYSNVFVASKCTDSL